MVRRALPTDFRIVFMPEPNLRKRAKNEFWVKRDELGASVAKNSTASFLYQKCLEWPSRPFFARFFVPEPKLQKRAKQEFWIKRDALGGSVAKNLIASFFVPKVARAALPVEFRTVFRSGTETPKRAKHEFWVTRDGLGASVVKNSTASFLYQKCPERPPQSLFPQFFRTGTKTPNTR